MLVVPEHIDERLTAFATRIDNSAPIRINVEPQTDSGHLNCGDNVARAVSRSGGQAVKGWQVWWIPNVLIEAQAHVVWQRPDGTVVDVTPNQDGKTECVFIPDSTLQANPGVDYVPSRHENLTEDTAVDRYIECARVVSDHQDRKFTSGIPMPPPPEQAEMTRLLSRLAELAAEQGG